MRRGAIVRIAGIGVVTAILVSLVAVLIPWLPDSASKQMDRIEFVYWFATVISIAIFSLVVAVLLYSVITFRSPPEDESDGPSIHGHTGLEIVWTVVPAVLVIAIGVLSAVVLSQNGNAGTKPMTVKVFAQQFAWRFEYPGERGLKSTELVLPVNRDVTFRMQSADVIHSFWIPDMGQKQDLVPGIETSIVITPTREGTFPLVCTELCGLGHATMRAQVRVLSQAGFAAWVKKQQGSGGAGAGGGAGGGAAGGGGSKAGGGTSNAGAAVFSSAGCGGCHAFSPAGSNGAIGPKLDNLAAAAAKAGQDPAAFVRESIVNPNKMLAPGYAANVMPGNFGDSLSAKQIDALVAYLTAAKP